MHASAEASGFPGPNAGNHEENDQPRRTVDGRRRGWCGARLCAGRQRCFQCQPWPSCRPIVPALRRSMELAKILWCHPAPGAPGDMVPYDRYIKNPGGGVDLPS